MDSWGQSPSFRQDGWQKPSWQTSVERQLWPDVQPCWQNPVTQTSPSWQSRFPAQIWGWRIQPRRGVGLGSVPLGQEHFGWWLTGRWEIIGTNSDYLETILKALPIRQFAFGPQTSNWQRLTHFCCWQDSSREQSSFRRQPLMQSVPWQMWFKKQSLSVRHVTGSQTLTSNNGINSQLGFISNSHLQLPPTHRSLDAQERSESQFGKQIPFPQVSFGGQASVL